MKDFSKLDSKGKLKYARKNLTAILDVLKNLTKEERKHFDMSSWRHKENECGTTYCALGWAIKKGVVPLKFSMPDANGHSEPIPKDKVSPDIEAHDILGISYETFGILFCPGLNMNGSDTPSDFREYKKFLSRAIKNLDESNLSTE